LNIKFLQFLYYNKGLNKCKITLQHSLFHQSNKLDE